ncbi:MAG: hypothetical protein IKT53_05585, partial [Bacteroidaceae bacterium]|nr:hypothetical protein [Bacteroidaceae bacterium]
NNSYSNEIQRNSYIFLKNIPKKQIQCNKSREGDPLTLLGHPLLKGGGSLNKNTSNSFKLLRLQTLLRLNPPPLIQEEEFKPLHSNLYQKRDRGLYKLKYRILKELNTFTRHQ